MYYLQNLVPLVGQTATTSDGLAVWANVPPGAVTYSGTDQETGEVVTVGTVQVTAGWQTFVWAYPKAVR